MKKKVDFVELCEMIRDGKQPRKIKVHEQEFEWDGIDYENSNGKTIGFVFVLDCICKTKAIEFYDDVLDEIELEYLSAIVKPFRDKVDYITKVANISENTESILIVFKGYCALVLFPPFIRGKMYKGMEIAVRYTLEELGI